MPSQPSGLAFRVGLGKQSAEGTADTQPEFEIPYWGGSIGPAEDRADFEVSSTLFIRPGAYKTQARWATDGLTLGVFPASSGLPYLLMLGQEVFAAATPNTHTITTIDPNPMWCTFFGQVPAPTGGSVSNVRYEDGVVSAVELQFAAGQPVRMLVEASGKTVTFNSPGTWTAGATEAYTSAGPYISSVSPTLKMDVASTPGSTTVTNIVSGSLRVERPVVWENTTLITPSYRSQSLLTATCSLTVEFDSMNYFRSTYFGGTSGTTLSPIIVSGSLDFLFQQGPTTGTHNLRVQIPNIDYRMSTPVLDTGGGPLHATVEGTMSAPASGAPVTVIASNAQAAY